MIFRQLFDAATSTFTYLLGDELTREALLIDPVAEQIDRDALLVEQLSLKLKYSLDTHVHADHITAASLLRDRYGTESIVGAKAGAACTNIPVHDGSVIELGDIRIEVIETPGHTPGCVSYYIAEEGMLFSGDSLMIRGCGRTDFQAGDSAQMHHSIVSKLYQLPSTTRLFPGHDYRGHSFSTIEEEKKSNPRIPENESLESFQKTMAALKLARPKWIDAAVPANLACGRQRQDDQPNAWAPTVLNTEGIPELMPKWVAAHRTEHILLDVREVHELSGELPALEDALRITLGELPNTLGRLSPEASVITICRSGKRSAVAAKILIDAGFKKVASMQGGMALFHSQALPLA